MQFGDKVYQVQIIWIGCILKIKAILNYSNLILQECTFSSILVTVFCLLCASLTHVSVAVCFSCSPNHRELHEAIV